MDLGWTRMTHGHHAQPVTALLCQLCHSLLRQSCCLPRSHPGFDTCPRAARGKRKLGGEGPGLRAQRSGIGAPALLSSRLGLVARERRQEALTGQGLGDGGQEVLRPRTWELTQPSTYYLPSREEEQSACCLLYLPLQALVPV